MSIVEYYGDSSPRGIIRHWERKTKSDCAYEILRCWKRIEELKKTLAQQQEAEPVFDIGQSSTFEPCLSFSVIAKLVENYPVGTKFYTNPPKPTAQLDTEASLVADALATNRVKINK